MANLLSQALTEAVVRRLAGAQTWQRGQDYFSGGHVESFEFSGEALRAVVRGSQNYAVALAADDGVLDYFCDCRAAEGGTFCKHCVAAALAWLNRGAAPQKSPERLKTKKFTLADAGNSLRKEEKEALVQMVLEWAKDDDRLNERLILYAARRAGPEFGAAAVMQAFQRAVRVDGYLDYRESAGWAQDVDASIDSVEQLLRDGQAAAVVGLCESALQSLLRAVESVDDSDGHFGMLRDRLQEIHFRACRESPPDPVDLAKRLFHWELHSDLDVFFGAAERYATILGSSGMKALRELADAEWAKVPARTAKRERFEFGKHFRITHIMESLARASGSVEELVAVMKKDLSTEYSYLKIAEVCHEAGQSDNALLWAEEGLKKFPGGTDIRLREFAANEYHRRGRHGDAMALIWGSFLAGPRLETWQTLEMHAKKAEAWPQWRERALSEIRLRLARAAEKPRSQSRQRWLPDEHADHSVLVEIFLHEGKDEDAWREAGAGGCSDRLWLRLAARRDKDHPEDAVTIYLRYAEAGVAAITNGRYQDPVNLLVKAAEAMKRVDRSAEFVRLLETLRTKYKIKRNFIKLVEEKRRLLYLS